jgi:hypothetical protein
MSSSIFNVEVRDINDDAKVHLIHITEIGEVLKKYLDDSIIRICEGATDSTISYIKSRLINYLTPKIDSDLELGSIAEFFAHLYLREQGFNQEFLFMNLEEGSIKKGFDGYYSKNNEEWIFESKSGRSTTAGISHPVKIKGAFDDLSNKVSGGSKNNPWQNAYNHASQIDVGSVLDLRTNLKTFSREYEAGTYHNISDFNVIPGSTIFYFGDWTTIDNNDVTAQLQNWIDRAEFKKFQAICISSMSKDLFWDYLNLNED